jgi:hypothetical protein
VRRRRKESTGLGSEYEKIVHHPSERPKPEPRSIRKIALWVVLLMPVGLYFLVRRFGGPRAVGFVVAILVPLMLLVALGAVLGSDVESSPPAAEASSKPQQPAQLRAERIRAAKIARQQAHAKARTAKIVRERARAEARAHAAYVAAANRWHTGFEAYDYGEGLYYRWRDGLGCAAYSDYCWRLEVTTRGGCSSLFVEANEKNRGGTIIGDLIDARDNIPPKTRVLFELDSTAGSTYSVASGLTITCNRY